MRPTGDTSGAGPRHAGSVAATALRRAGVDTLFTVPGEHILPLLDGCRDAGVRVIGTRHEGAAALAAEGWALATGEPGAAAVTAGPGFANALVGLLDAGVWSLPLVLIAGRTGLDKRGRGAVMDVDQRAVAAPVVKDTVCCFDVGRLEDAVARAVHLARAGPPGAVYLEVPADVLDAQPPAPGQREAGGGFPSPLPRPSGDPGALARVVDLLAGAERPVAIAGGGAFWAGASSALTRFAETCGVPVVTTSAARGVVADSHPWCLGNLLHAGGASLAADLVVVLGSAFNGNLAFGRSPLFTADQTVVQVDVAPERLGGNRRPDTAVVGDVAAVLEQLTDRWTAAHDPAPAARREWREQAAAITADLKADWDRQVAGHAGDRLHAGAVIREAVDAVRQMAGEQVTFVADGGDALAWALAYTDAQAPGRLLSTTTALGTLGVGLPFALAARAARPDEPVVLLTGDGAFGLSAMELSTCVNHDLPVVCVVSNNGAWGDVAHAQDASFGPGRRVASDLADSRYDRLADALGGHGERVTALAELRPALKRSLDSGAPAVIDVATDPTVLSDLLANIGDLGIM